MSGSWDRSNIVNGRCGRRAVLQVGLQAGALGLLSLGAADLARLRAASTGDAERARQQRNSCVFLFLFGGPSQIDLWDMKPEAPREIRGEFRPVSTQVPGIALCEHLPLMAQQMDKFALLRSMTHRMNVHGPACSQVFTGRDYFGPPTTDEALPEDWPSLSSLTARFGTPDKGMPPSVVLPWYLQFPGQSRRIAGQTGARMGERYNAFLIDGELERTDFEVEGLRYHADAPLARIRRRRGLQDALETAGQAATVLEVFQRNRRNAYALLENNAGAAFDLNRETPVLREAYGRTAVGQSLLMARRLVEAGVGLVTVNWQDETMIDGVNTCWDTHQNNFAKLKDLLCPILDRAFSTFLSDLHERGLLETTLVVALGEFGRTPKLGEFTQSANTKKTGRDHWPHAFTTLIAGGGVRGGQVYGGTTRTGGYVADKPVTPGDLTATVLQHLGIDHTLVYENEFQKLRHRLSDGEPLRDLG